MLNEKQAFIASLVVLAQTLFFAHTWRVWTNP